MSNTKKIECRVKGSVKSLFEEGDLSFDIKTPEKHTESVEYRSGLHEFEIMKGTDGKIAFTNVKLDSNTCRKGSTNCSVKLDNFDSSKPIKVIYDRLDGTQNYADEVSLEQCESDRKCGGLVDIWLV